MPKIVLTDEEMKDIFKDVDNRNDLSVSQKAQIRMALTVVNTVCSNRQLQQINKRLKEQKRLMEGK